MGDVIRDRYPAFVAPLWWEVDETDTTVGEASHIAAHPIPVADAGGRYPALALGSTGALAPDSAASTGDSIRIQTLIPGHLGATRFAWTYTKQAGASVSQDYRGADVPAVVTSHFGGGWSSGTEVRRFPHAQELPNGDIVVVAATQTSSGAGTYRVAVQTYDASAGTWSGETVLASNLPTAHAPYPTITRVDEPERPDIDGLLLVAYWRVDTGVNEAQVVMYVSRDDGATWALYARDTLDAVVDIDATTGYDLGRLRVCYGGGQLLLMGALSDNNAGGVLTQIWQWASRDLGQTFENIADDNNADTARNYPDIVYLNDKFYVGYLEQSGASTTAIGKLKELGSAWEPFDEALTIPLFSSATRLGTAGGATSEVTDGDLALVKVPNRRILGLARKLVSSSWTGHAAIVDPTLAEVLTVPEKTFSDSWFDDGQSTTTEYPKDFDAVWRWGGVDVIGRLESAVTTFEDQWTHLVLGKYSTITMPALDNTWTEVTRAGWDSTTIATASPGSQGWSSTGAGTVSLTTNLTWFQLTTAAAQLYFYRAPTIASGSEILASQRVKTVSGSAAMSRGVMIGLRSSDGATVGYHVELRFSDTQIQLYDVNAGAQVAIVSADVATGVEVLFALRDAACYAWYREIADDGTDGDDREWTEVGSSSGLTDDAGAGGGDLIEWGNRTTSTVVAQYGPIRYKVTSGGDGWSDGFANTDDLWAAVTPDEPEYVAAGLSISASAGPGATGDIWDIAGDARYPARNALPVGHTSSSLRVRGGLEPSPDVGHEWRSTATSGRLAFVTLSGGQTRLDRGILVFHVERPNWATATAQYKSGSWSSFGTIDTRGDATTLPYTRAAGSHIVVVNTGGSFTNKPIIEAMELAGGYVNLGSNKVRPILRNGGGIWSADGLAPLPWIELDPDSLDGTEGTTGTLDIWYPRVTFVAIVGSTSFEKVGINFGTVNNYEGYIRAGAVYIGEAWPTDVLPDWGLSRGILPPGEFDTLQTGQRIATAYRDTREALVLPFGAAMKGLVAAPRATYKATTTGGATVVAATGTGYTDLIGLIRALKGSRWPTVYVPGIVDGPTDTYCLVGNQSAIYGRIVSEQIERVLQSGDEQDPWYALGSVEFEQEL